MRSLASCLTEILIVQETNKDLWESGIVKRSFALLLSFCMNDNSKVRHHVQDELMRILQFHYERAFAVSSYQILRQLDILLKSFNEDEYHDVINYLLFIAKSCLFLHNDVYPSLFSSLLKVSNLIRFDSRCAVTAAPSWITAVFAPSRSSLTALASSPTPPSTPPSSRSNPSQHKSPTTRRTFQSTISFPSNSSVTTSSSSTTTAKPCFSPPPRPCSPASPPPMPPFTSHYPSTSSPTTPVWLPWYVFVPMVTHRV